MIDPIVNHAQFLNVQIFSNSSGFFSQGSGFSQSAGEILMKADKIRRRR